MEKKYDEKLEFDRNEYQTKITDVPKAMFSFFKAFFGKQKDNQMLKDLNIKKGLIPGLSYLLYLSFVLPFKILAWILTPKWEWVFFVKRHIVSPMFEVDAISGEDSPSNILGELYEKYLNALKSSENTGIDSHITPEISRLERLIIFAKLREIITLLFFAEIFFELYDNFDVIVEVSSMILGIFTSMFAFVPSLNLDRAVAGLFTLGITKYIVGIIGGALISYLMIVGIRFVVETIKHIMYADRNMMLDFVDDTLHYTVSKAIETHGKDTAYQAYELLIENVVLNKQLYSKKNFHYKELPNSAKLIS